MHNRLLDIINKKITEVALLKEQSAHDPSGSLLKILSGYVQQNPAKNFKRALSTTSLAVIAEIKRRSPSKGDLASIADPTDLALRYVQGKADAISVLTDTDFFNGSINDLINVSHVLEQQPIPILRKDFIIDPLQIAQARQAGADAVLLIAGVLGKKTKELLHCVHELGMQALVEIHNEIELEIALESGADIIGINNRDLTTFAIDTQNAFSLLEKIPKDIISVAESGIVEPALARDYHQAGFNAVLIGEALVKEENPEKFIQACKK